MKQFIDKLIERLEEEKQSSPCRNTQCKDCKYTNQCYEGEQCYKVGIDNIKEIVNQLAEEYKPNTNADIQEVIDKLEVYTVGRLNTSKVEISVLQLQRYINRLKQLAEESVVHGEWHKEYYGIRTDVNTGKPIKVYQCTCSVCGWKTGNQGTRFKYCPMCGAKMDSDNKGE